MKKKKQINKLETWSTEGQLPDKSEKNIYIKYIYIIMYIFFVYLYIIIYIIYMGQCFTIDNLGQV